LTLLARNKGGFSLALFRHLSQPARWRSSGLILFPLRHVTWLAQLKLPLDSGTVCKGGSLTGAVLADDGVTHSAEDGSGHIGGGRGDRGHGDVEIDDLTARRRLGEYDDRSPYR
jgi:hypothetical protein